MSVYFKNPEDVNTLFKIEVWCIWKTGLDCITLDYTGLQVKLDHILLSPHFLEIFTLNHEKNTKNKYNNDNEVF